MSPSRRSNRTLLSKTAPGLATLLLAGPALAAQLGDRPTVVQGTPIATHYDGLTDDLLTAGLGASGLGSATAPSYANPLAPTPAELRRAAIYTNYRALVDPTTGGGFGTFYGPNVAIDGTVTTGSGMIAGTEYVMLTRVSSRNSNVLATVSVVVQIPDSYNPGQGCIVTAPSSGSRGPYGAIATAGEWGLKHGCAVAYTDKGSGIGFDDLHNDYVDLVQGQLADAVVAGSASSFTARLSGAQRAMFDAQLPNRFAFKHAHSQANPEADWGLYVLQSVQVAFWLLNQQFAPNASSYPINRGNTVVIGSSVSNGGGASLRAAEQDTQHLLDGVAVAEPNVQPTYSSAFAIQQGSAAPLPGRSRTLFDYITLENVFAGCAAAQPSLSTAPLNLAPSAGRCSSLAAAGLLTAGTTAAEAAQAQGILNAAGILPEQNFVSPSHWFAYVHQSIAMTYANAYGKFSVADDVCGYSFGATGANGPVALAPAAEAVLFATGNGIPPTGGVNLINDLGPAGPAEDRVSTPDQDLRGALCLRGLAIGQDPVTGAALDPASAAQAARIAAGVVPVRATGLLNGIPAIWVAGRNDGILPPNFTGRAYYGLTQTLGSDTHYYEVTNAQHLDSFNQYAGFNSTLVPLHVYFLRAMDMMLAHIRTGAPFPPSQVIHTTPRGAGAPPLVAADVPAIANPPAPADAITLASGVLNIPN